MFKTKKQLKERIKQLEWDIEELKISKDIAVNQLKIAEGEMKKAKSEANFWKTRFENVENIKKENEKLRKQLTCGGILDIIRNNLDILQENEELKEKIKTLNDVIANAKLNLTIKDNEKCKLTKSILEKNTEISKLKDKNIELQSNIVTLTATIQNLRELILK